MPRDDDSPLDEIGVGADELISLMRRIETGEPWPADEDLPVEAGPELTQAEANRLMGELYSVMKSVPPPECLAPVTPPCKAKPIGSHSIQRAGPLTLLADGSGHVFSLEPHRESGQPSAARMRRVGTRRASTFPGLCKKHDESLFRPIDREPLSRPTPEQLFLLSYRAVLREHYVGRLSELQLARTLRLAIEARVPRNHIAVLLAHLTRMRWGAARLKTIAGFYARVHQGRLYEDGLSHLTGRNIWLLPFAVGAYFEPVFKPDGSRIPGGLGPGVGPFLTLNVVPHPDGSIVLLSYPAEHRATLHEFLQPFRPPIEELTFVERIWEIALRYCENIIVAPNYWNVVPGDVQARIVDFYNSTRHAWVPSPGSAISLFDWIRKMSPEDARAPFDIKLFDSDSDSQG
jgi:hypothetical protein